ncbi:pilus (MSHA type) biogenesis protein MshL [Denitratisoma sp. agr-D3]
MSLDKVIPVSRLPLSSAAVLLPLSLVLGCATPRAMGPASAHLSTEDLPLVTGTIPAPVQTTLSLPRPRLSTKTETYSVVVNNVRAQDLLFALARDAKLNIDIHPGIDGNVTLNAIDQSLQQLLGRIAKQVDMRWELDGKNLAVVPDTPFLRTYRVDYVNMNRDTSGTVTVTTQIASSPGMAGTTTVAGSPTSGGNNNSLTRIENKAQHHFWGTLEKNIKDILHETDKILPEGSSETLIERTDQRTVESEKRNGSPLKHKNGNLNPSHGGVDTSQEEGSTFVRRSTFREAAAVIVNAEAGVVTVRATARQHEKIQEFLDQVLASARRQVMIEATIAEVRLADNYQQGINWSALALGRAGFTVKQGAAGALTAPTASFLELSYSNNASRLGNLSGTIKLLESFGNVRVLSSPKLSVINNQTAVLKVVDNNVYFTIKADTTTNQTTSTTTYTTTLQSVPVGFVMNVTPQIGEQDTVLLNIRPSISRIVDYVDDPNPALKAAGVTSKIPVIRTREMESMMRIDNGNIAVMGGLMEDELNEQRDGIPGLSRLPGVGNFFQQRNDSRNKTELIVFLRPTVIKEASLRGDFQAMQDNLPGKEFFSMPQDSR